VQDIFAPTYGIDAAALEIAFDVLFKDDDEFRLGKLSCQVIRLPDHTPDYIGYGMSISRGAG
jgi:glyoxylase-like metal-dependent hydrolase (beta-lactamase superfamily II)